jgi:hypothetical protein
VAFVIFFSHLYHFLYITFRLSLSLLQVALLLLTRPNLYPRPGSEAEILMACLHVGSHIVRLTYDGHSRALKWLKINLPSTDGLPPLTRRLAYLCGAEGKIILDIITDPSHASIYTNVTCPIHGVLRFLGHLLLAHNSNRPSSRRASEEAPAGPSRVTSFRLCIYVFCRKRGHGHGSLTSSCQNSNPQRSLDYPSFHRPRSQPA